MTSATRRGRAPELVERRPHRRGQRARVVDVDRVQRGRRPRPARSRSVAVRADDPAAAWRPATRRSRDPEAISTPTDGGGLVRKLGSRAHSTKVTLLISRRVVIPASTRSTAGLAQRPHALVARRLLDLGVRPPGQDDLADVIGQIEQLAYGGPPLEPGAAALDAAGPLEEQAAVGQVRVHLRLDQRTPA